MAKLVIQSAKFKRDYVAGAAVALFVLIVAVEIALAVSIPSYLDHEAALARDVRRLRLMQSFDGARGMAYNINPAKIDPTAFLEVRLVVWNLDQLAPYLRKHAKRLSETELAALQASVDSMLNVLAKIRSGYVYSSESRLDTSGYINSLLTREKGKNGETK